MSKISIRFFDKKELRAVWDEESNKWWFSVVDIVAVLSDSADARNNWYVLKNRLKKANSEVLTNCKELKLTAPDDKKRLSDTLDSEGVILFAKQFPGNKAVSFLDRFTYSDNTIDGQSKKKAYTFWESNLIGSAEVGSIKALQKFHTYIFGGLYNFAGQIRTKNISKGGFTFAPCQYFNITLPTIERMPETTFDEIVDKYVEMNVAHPLMEGNGRTTRIWLDLIFR